MTSVTFLIRTGRIANVSLLQKFDDLGGSIVAG
jgi:hypothetical protein